jgi:hypothetical protein
MRRLSDRGHLLPADLPSLADPPSMKVVDNGAFYASIAGDLVDAQPRLNARD